MPKRTRLQTKAAAKKQQYQWKRQRGLLNTQISQGGVAGAGTRVRPSLRPSPPELKYFDTTIGATTQNEFWNIISNLSLANITPGTGAGQRTGRKIRVKGIVFRGRAKNSPSETNTSPCPYTMDFIWDKQCNGDVPPITQIYTTVSSYGLPNPLYDKRFKFIKRVESADPNSAYQMLNIKIKCDEVITFDGNTGLIGDLSGSNLLVTYVSPWDAAPDMTGQLRILYTDE